MSINRKIAKMYLPGVRVSDVIKLIAYVAFLATCVYKVSVSINYKWLGLSWPSNTCFLSEEESGRLLRLF